MKYLNRVYRVITRTQEFVGLSDTNHEGNVHFGSPSFVLYRYYDTSEVNPNVRDHIIIPVQQICSAMELKPKVFPKKWIKTNQDTLISDEGNLPYTRTVHLPYVGAGQGIFEATTRSGGPFEMNLWYRAILRTTEGFLGLPIKIWWGVGEGFKTFEDARKVVEDLKSADWYTEEEMNTSYQLPGFIDWGIEHE